MSSEVMSVTETAFLDKCASLRAIIPLQLFDFGLCLPLHKGLFILLLFGFVQLS